MAFTHSRQEPTFDCQRDLQMFETDIENEKEPEHSGSFLYWSVPYYWLKEWRLSRAARQWVPTSATVESGYRTKGGYKETIRAELRYSYHFNQQHHFGEMVRECVFDSAAANALACDYTKGDQITIFVNPVDPDQSYFASGFGSMEPILTGALALLGTSLLLFILVGMLVAGLTGNLR
ncbi:DUF3592 domain-containing protein [Telmatobacter bradus]|uniref:DUF3592 domain-containing protein n=1 Tax=Telmatobacter bradus TaxID=474953 RepID=UPI003B43C42F